MKTNEMIVIDKNYADRTAIDTETWLDAVLGEECHGIFDDGLGDKRLMQAENTILSAIEERTGVEYEFINVDNTCNDENDFSNNFQWQVYYPVDCTDWLYANDVFVAVKKHHGGGVRGNYGRIRLYRVDSLVDSGFFDWVLGWNVTYSDGTDVPENERFSISYSSHPFSEMKKHLKDRLQWSDKYECFVGWYHDGRAVKCTPYTYAEM